MRNENSSLGTRCCPQLDNLPPKSDQFGLSVNFLECVWGEASQERFWYRMDFLWVCFVSIQSLELLHRDCCTLATLELIICYFSRKNALVNYKQQQEKKSMFLLSKSIRDGLANRNVLFVNFCRFHNMHCPQLVTITLVFGASHPSARKIASFQLWKHLKTIDVDQ